MKSVVCTLFEGHYHFGLAALANSLYHQGYRGTIHAGYRGALPSWTLPGLKDASTAWPGSQILKIADELQIHFLPLHTDYHLTNYKPDFMLQLWQSLASGASAMFYFDPDIVVSAPWSFFEEWVSSGMALCEDVNSPLAEFHPRRMAWRRIFGDNGITLKFKNSIYVNGGFVGVNHQNLSFLEAWRSLQEIMAPLIGGLNRSSLTGTPLPENVQGPFSPFSKTDQDALNAAIEAWNGVISFIGKEGMAFKSGAPLMPHALGHPKPWQWNPLWQVLAGRPPRLVDKQYWHYVNGPIVSHSLRLVRQRKLFIAVASFIGRFYRKGGL